MMTVMRFSQRYCSVQEEFLNCLKLKTMTLRSIETSIIVYQLTRHNIPKHLNIFQNVFCNIQHAGIKRLLKCLYDVKRRVIRRLLIKKTHTHTYTSTHTAESIVAPWNALLSCILRKLFFFTFIVYFWRSHFVREGNADGKITHKL